MANGKGQFLIPLQYASCATFCFLQLLWFMVSLLIENVNYTLGLLHVYRFLLLEAQSATLVCDLVFASAKRLDLVVSCEITL